jgi:hypothetical protein
MDDWLTIRVVLSEQADEPLEQPPGRVFVAHAEHELAELAEAIDTAFGRWDLSPLHQFEIEGRVLLPVGAELEGPEETDDVTLTEVGLRLGSRFTYVFDIGEGWTHECTVEEVGEEPFEDGESPPVAPVPVYGWGTIPDQYGTLVEDDDLDDDDDDLDDDLDDVVEVLVDDDEDEGGDGDGDGEGEAAAACWQVVDGALEDREARPDAEALRAAADALRSAGASTGSAPAAEMLWAAAGWDPEDGPDDDEELWTGLAAAVVVPRHVVSLDAATIAAWTALEPADWAGAVIELVRCGEGTVASPEALIELIERCPEIDGEELDEDEEAVILAGLEVAVSLWRALGALDDEGALTGLGIWGLPRSLERAWAEGG